MSLPRIEDYRWLISPDAAGRLNDLTGRDATSPAAISALRRTLAPARAHLVLEQVELRKRGCAKFTAADRMFFTPRSLEQATDQWTAAYKARRFANGSSVADLCCGVGGDLLSMAARGPTTGIDRDPIVSLLAQANLAVAAPAGSQVLGCDIDALDLAGFAACHLDPDRRPGDKRGVRPEDHEPKLEAVDRWLTRQPNFAVKLAPAARPPEAWQAQAECEWISRGGECRQLVVWHGELSGGAAGKKSAAALRSDGTVIGRFVQAGDFDDARSNVAVAPARYLFEPDAAVLAAGLERELAASLSLSSLGPGAAYFTGDQPLVHGLLASFEVRDCLPLDLRRLRGWCRQREIGRLEIKKRGVSHDPEAVRKKLKLQGDGSAVLFLTRVREDYLAVFAGRVNS